MTKQQIIQADTTSAVILQIPLEMLDISDLNPRKAVSEAHIESLADSIARFQEGLRIGHRNRSNDQGEHENGQANQPFHL